ncbi:hypothetical protein ACI6Q2_23285 [Chitinophagaceae bacterium LWZ2-11]
MKKKPSSRQTITRRNKPTMKWQTGAYDRRPVFSFCLPYQFLLLCKLMDVTPRNVLWHFMENLSGECRMQDRKEKAQDHLTAYFLEMGYGSDRYTSDDIRRMFKEMNAIASLWPTGADNTIMDTHNQWRAAYHKYWFKSRWKKRSSKL